MELEREQVARLRAELAENKKKSDNIAHEFKLKQDKLMEQTREKAASIIETTRYKSASLLNELEELKKSLNVQNAAKNIEAARAGYNKVLRELDDEANPVVKNQVVGEKLSTMPQSGDIVIINSINRDATVINTDEKGKRVFVMSGSMKMWAKLDDLRIKKSKESSEIKKTRNVTGLSSKAERNTSGEIDIRGMASDEAIIELDKYIDDAVLSGIGSIRIIHGKGTGVLRKAVQTHLRSHRSIKTFRIGLFGEGENGVTIAELND
jgi:DNA mismatch repair protein MutS2